jgi:DNA phosphorothioation-dependent restriction protein DptH
VKLANELIGAYIEQQCEAVLGAADVGSNKITLVVQSFPQLETCCLVDRVNKYFIGKNIPVDARAIKIAHGLWRSWSNEDKASLGDVESFARQFVDEDDQLTKFRNECHCVLIGYEHASDQGGLKDLTPVNENLLWECVLGGGFRQWVERISEEFDDDGGARESLSAFLDVIHKFNARSLVRVSRFLDLILAMEPETLRDFVDLCYFNLIAWGGLPLANLPIGRNLPKVARYVEASKRFATHASFQSKNDRNKAISKLAKAQQGDPPYQKAFELPAPVLEGDPTYADVDSYLADVRDYIEKNDQPCLDRVRRYDALPLLVVLEKPATGPKASPKSQSLRGYSDVVFLQAVFSAIKGFLDELKGTVTADLIEGIEINLLRYTSDGEEPEEEISRLLGGIDTHVIPDELVLVGDSGKVTIPITFTAHECVPHSGHGTNSKLEFDVTINSALILEGFERSFAWALSATHPEKLRLALSAQVAESLLTLPSPRLPGFHIGSFDEIFFATDEDDINRLLLLGTSSFETFNLLAGLNPNFVAQSLITKCNGLTANYGELLSNIGKEGFYSATAKISRVVVAYEELVADVVGSAPLGAEQILPRLYRAFAVVRDQDLSTNEYLDAAIALPVSPFVLDQAAGRAAFLRDGFSEVIAALFDSNRYVADLRWERLVGLAELRRPITGLVCDENKAITTRVRSFGLTHLFGSPSIAHLSLSSQSLMRDETFDEDDLGVKLRPTAESRIYQRLINDYQELHTHANDQMSLLFVNVVEIEILLSGIELWLKSYLKDTVEQQSPFVLNVKFITTGVAATTALNMLIAWRNQWSEMEDGSMRRCAIQIGHRHAQKTTQLIGFLKEESDARFDIAVIAHFLEGQHAGDQIEAVKKLNYLTATTNRQFPIAEYPRPVVAANAGTHRKTLLSNRRFRMASKHTDLSAKLKGLDTNNDKEHVILAQVHFDPWKETIALLHKKAIWVSCIDSYVDRVLLVGSELGLDDLRVVGFSCGLGNYGELNQTVSTEANDLITLTKAISHRLRGYLPNLTLANAECAAHNVIRASTEIPGLSLVRAAGHDQYIRDVVGYSLVNRILGRRVGAVLEVLIPLDSFRHWFSDREDSNIPDLLFLSARIKNDGCMDIMAVVIESKFALENQQLADTAFAQASSGLRQLARIFAPYKARIGGVRFDRKYWWAQLHRALASRVSVNMAVSDYKILCSGLDLLAEGKFSISWQAVAYTFWLNQDNPDTTPKFMGGVDIGASVPSPNGFGVYQLQFGPTDICKFLTQNDLSPQEIPGQAFFFSGDGDQTLAEVGQVANGIAPTSKSLQPISENQAPTKPTEVSVPTVPLPSTTKIVESELLTTVSSVLPQVAPDTAIALDKNSGLLRVQIGRDHKGQAVYWEHDDSELENRHLLIFGGSGSGKTYAIQGILIEMAKAGQHTAIVDYTDGFLPSHLDPVFDEFARPKTHVLAHEPFPINPFQRLAKNEPGIGLIEEKAHNVASRVADVFCSVYTVGDVQRAALTKSIERGLTDSQDFSLADLLTLLETTTETSGNLALKISEFVKQDPFSPGIGSGWENIFGGDRLVHILQLTSLSSEIQKLITEFALWDLFAYATRHGNKNTPLPVVLDEMQNLDHRSNQALDKLLREGRKFGVGLILATQTISNFDKEQKGRLFQAGHKLFFKPAETERQAFAQILADTSQTRTKSEWISELSKLNKGECWSLGPRRITETGLVKREPVKVKVLENSQRVLKQ